MGNGKDERRPAMMKRALSCCACSQAELAAYLRARLASELVTRAGTVFEASGSGNRPQAQDSISTTLSAEIAFRF